MLRSYNRHGRAKNKAVQVSCDAAEEQEFLNAMRKGGMKKLRIEYSTLHLTPHTGPLREGRRAAKTTGRPRKVGRGSMEAVVGVGRASCHADPLCEADTNHRGQKGEGQQDASKRNGSTEGRRGRGIEEGGRDWKTEGRWSEKKYTKGGIPEGRRGPDFGRAGRGEQ